MLERMLGGRARSGRERADWLFIAKNNFLWQQRRRVTLVSFPSPPPRRRRAPGSLLTPHSRFLFEFPESCYVKDQRIYWEQMRCVIAHDERSVGCKSLCPLLPIIPSLFLCVCVSTIFASFDKGTRTANSLPPVLCVWPAARRCTHTSVRRLRSVWHQD